MITTFIIQLFSCVQLNNSKSDRVGTVACLGGRYLNQQVGRPANQIAEVLWDDGSRTTHNVGDLVIVV